MAHFYALFRRQQQISNSFLRMDEMTEDELFQKKYSARVLRARPWWKFQLLELVRDDLEDRQADITPPFLPIRSCSPPSSSFRGGTNQWFLN